MHLLRLLSFDSATITVRLVEETSSSNGNVESREDEINIVDEEDSKDSDSITRSGRPIRSSNRLRQSKRRSKMRTIKITKDLNVKDIKVEVGVPASLCCPEGELTT